MTPDAMQGGARRPVYRLNVKRRAAASAQISQSRRELSFDLREQKPISGDIPPKIEAQKRCQMRDRTNSVLGLEKVEWGVGSKAFSFLFQVAITTLELSAN